MAAPTITNGEEHFFPIIYSGNGQGQRVGKFLPFTDNGTIAKSCMFNDGDNPYLSRTNDAGDRDTFTISVWVKRCVLGAVQHIFDTYDGSSSNDGYIRFNADNTISTRIGSPSNHLYTTNRTFEDTSKWYHIMLSVNTNDSTAADRVKLYVDGDRITSFSTQTNAGSADDTQFNYSSATFRIGSTTSGSYDFDGYLAEFNQVDGTALTPSTFGLTNTSTGLWIPKTLTGITYGTNGFRLQFGTDSALGDDTSGNTNDFTSSGLTTSDQRNDTPTNNLPTIRPYNPSYSQVLYEGNLTHYTNGTNTGYPMVPTLRPKSGKYYAECRVSGDGGGNTVDLGVLLQEDMHNYSSGMYYPGNNNGSGWNSAVGYGDRGFYQQVNGTNTFVKFISETIAGGDVVGMALDIDNGLLSYYNNSGSLVGSIPFDNNKTPMFAATSNTSITFIWNFGDNGTFAGYETAGGNSDSDGNGNFYHSVPTGFKMLTQDSMPETDKGITGLTWIKDRDNSSYFHTLYDSSRGVMKELYSNSTSVEATQNNGLHKFLKGGFQTGDAVNTNTSGDSFVSWNWVANGGTTASNTDGSLSSTVQANTTAGFSIVRYDGSGTGSTVAGTVGHGLGQKPDCIIVKCETNAHEWTVYHAGISDPSDKVLYLDATNAETDWPYFGDTDPTSSVFTVSSDLQTGRVNYDYVAYCWTGIDGYSKFGSYSGNGDTDGKFVYTGFKPAWILVKRRDSAGYDWQIWDTKRSPINPSTNQALFPNGTTAEGGTSTLDILSNGFKWRSTGAWLNASGGTYIYMAFAEHPFVGDGTSPVTAR